MKPCPNCSYPNPDERDSCFKCGSDLNAPAVQEDADPQADAPVDSSRQPHIVPKPMPLAQALLILLAMVVGCAVVATSMYNNKKRSQELHDEMWHGAQKKTFFVVRYRVTGTTDHISVTYANEDGGTCQANDMAVPWSKSFVMHKGAFLYVSAQNQKAYGDVTVTIYVDDEEYRSSASSGAYAIADANGSL